MQLILCATTASTQPTILIEAAKGFVADKTYAPKYGARPLNRAIQKYIEDPIAEEILEAEIAQGDIITGDFAAGAEELTFSTSKGDGVAIPQASDERPEEAPEASDDEPTDSKKKGE